MSEVLTSDYIRAELYGITGYDNTAARKAIEFVNDEPRKFDLFKRLWPKNPNQSPMVQAETVITKVKEAEALLFEPITKSTK
ncbi:DUF2560 family protein [Providencia rettgeri]